LKQNFLYDFGRFIFLSFRHDVMQLTTFRVWRGFNSEIFRQESCGWTWDFGFWLKSWVRTWKNCLCFSFFLCRLTCFFHTVCIPLMKVGWRALVQGDREGWIRRKNLVKMRKK
jgi:hypothetical protein